MTPLSRRNAHARGAQRRGPQPCPGTEAARSPPRPVRPWPRSGRTPPRRGWGSTERRRCPGSAFAATRARACAWPLRRAVHAPGELHVGRAGALGTQFTCCRCRRRRRRRRGWMGGRGQPGAPRGQTRGGGDANTRRTRVRTVSQPRD